MHRFKAIQIALLLRELKELQANCLSVKIAEGGGTKPQTNVLERANKLLETANDLAEECQFTAAKATAIFARAHYHQEFQLFDVSMLAADFRHLEDDFLNDISKQSFLRVQESRRSYLENDALFGDAVKRAFPSASSDLQEAGNCLAADCNTGAVFHLMRAAEVALRALASDRRATFQKGTLDSKQWGEIISKLTGITNEMSGLPAASWPSEEIRQTQIRFYQEVMIEFRAFNDVWRRHVSHAHDGAMYDSPQATSAKNHTEQFMKKLATKISETTTTDEYWQTI